MDRIGEGGVSEISGACIPIRWICAEKEFADKLRKFFGEKGITIEVIVVAPK